MRGVLLPFSPLPGWTCSLRITPALVQGLLQCLAHCGCSLLLGWSSVTPEGRCSSWAELQLSGLRGESERKRLGLEKARFRWEVI